MLCPPPKEGKPFLNHRSHSAKHSSSRLQAQVADANAEIERLKVRAARVAHTHTLGSLCRPVAGPAGRRQCGERPSQGVCYSCTAGACMEKSNNFCMVQIQLADANAEIERLKVRACSSCSEYAELGFEIFYWPVAGPACRCQR